MKNESKRGARMASKRQWTVMLGGAVGLVALQGCADPCADDGLQQDGKDPACPGLLSQGGGTTDDDDDTTGLPPADTGTPSTCEDGVQNGDETDVDCGGSCDDACGGGQGCGTSADCISGVCEEGVCQEPACDDTVLNGEETDIDCGGTVCPACDDGRDCVIDQDCESDVCGEGNTCEAPTCDDTVQNGDETDVDCGGDVCPGCDDGEMCIDDMDCLMGECTDGTCIAETCRDRILNGDETDIDCGGPLCPGCDDGEMCMEDGDCASDECDPTNTCITPTCTDAAQNGDETDVDCGGSCPGCDDGEMCMENGDCMSQVCDPGTNTCAAPTCTDAVQNGDETDVDCGGPLCPDCDDGEMCVEDGDCASQVCDPGTNTCVPPSCRDGNQNGDETDLDCGGSCGPTCDTGEDCLVGNDCISLVCDPTTLTCNAPVCDDGVQNGDETDLDCGGSCGSTCDTGEDCLVGVDCISLVCDPTTLTCNAPVCDDGVQNGDETDIDCGQSCGPTCEFDEGCLVGGDCISMVCDPLLGTCAAPTCLDGVQNGDETDIDCGGSCGPTCDTGETCEDGGDCINDVCDPLDSTCAPPLTVDAEPACTEFTGVPVPLTATASGGTGAYTYLWTPAAGLDDATSSTPNASPTGFETYTVTADDGVNTAQDTATVVNATAFDLENNCTLYQGDFLSGTPNASITYSDGGTVACENLNNDFGLHLCDGVTFESVSLQGELSVVNDPGNDDDIIGLVWGAQNNSTFYSLTWKRQAQPFFGCAVPMGIVVKRVEAATFDDLTGADVYCPNDTAQSTLLLNPLQTLALGWQEGEIYDVTIDFTPTGSDVTIVRQGDGVTIAAFAVTDNTFTSGFFGSTTISQQSACVGPLNASCL